MIVKDEAEAQTKWCPFARVLTANKEQNTAYMAPAHNRIGYPAGEGGLPQAAFCIASDCMMWRRLSEKGGCCGLAHPNP